MAPLLLQVPITINGGKPQIGKASIVSETPMMAQNLANAQVSAAKSRLHTLKRKLRIAEMEYKRNPNPNNFKIVEAIKAEIKRLLGAISAGQAQLTESYKKTLISLRRKIKSVKRRLKTAHDGAKKVLTKTLDSLIIRYYNLRIKRVEPLIAKNRTNASAIRRRITKHRDIVIAIKAQEKRQVIPDAAMKVRRMSESAKLNKARVDMKKVDMRYKQLKRLLDRLKAGKNRFLTKRTLANVVSGQVSGNIAYIRKILMRHDRILKELMKFSAPRRRIRRVTKSKCGNLGLTQRRLRKAVIEYRKIHSMNKKRPTRKTRLLLRAARERVAALRARVKAIRKCKGIILCGNLKKAYRNLARAKASYRRVMKIAKDRPSDEDAQKDRHKYMVRVRKHRHMIKKIWTCICNRAQIKYHLNERMFSKTGKKIFKDRMKVHKKTLHRCNCRAANINYSRAREQFIRHRNRYQANTMDQKSKDKMDFYYKKVMQHYERLKLYKCKLPPLPRTIQTGGVVVGRRRR